MIYIIYTIIIFIIILLFLYSITESDDNYKFTRTINNDGYQVFQNVNKNIVLSYLPEGYVFLDYIYTIKGCTLQTFHRDVTSSQYVLGTKYPLYTYIEYKNKGPTLSVCPNSHKSTPFLWSSPLTIHNDINENLSVLFNCDLVHSGAINNLYKKRHAIQYKIAHVDDLKYLNSLIGVRKVKNNACDVNKIHEYILRKFSLVFCYPINHIFTSYLQSYQNNFINKLAIYIFGKSFYNI